MSEAIFNTTGEPCEREAVLAPQGSPGPASAARDALFDAEEPLMRISASARLLVHAAASGLRAEEAELDFLANAIRDAHAELQAAVEQASELLRPLSSAERAAAEAARNKSDPDEAEQRARAFARSAIEFWRDARRKQQHAHAGVT